MNPLPNNSKWELCLSTDTGVLHRAFQSWSDCYTVDFLRKEGFKVTCFTDSEVLRVVWFTRVSSHSLLLGKGHYLVQRIRDGVSEFGSIWGFTEDEWESKFRPVLSEVNFLERLWRPWEILMGVEE